MSLRISHLLCMTGSVPYKGMIQRWRIS